MGLLPFGHHWNCTAAQTELRCRILGNMFYKTISATPRSPR